MLPSRIGNGRAGGPGERVHPYSRGCPVQAPWAGVLIEWPHSHCRKDPSALSVSPSSKATQRERWDLSDSASAATRSTPPPKELGRGTLVSRDERAHLGHQPFRFLCGMVTSRVGLVRV